MIDADHIVEALRLAQAATTLAFTLLAARWRKPTDRALLVIAPCAAETAAVAQQRRPGRTVPSWPGRNGRSGWPGAVVGPGCAGCRTGCAGLPSKVALPPASRRGRAALSA